MIAEELPGVVLIDSADETAADVVRVLERYGLGNSTSGLPTHRFIATDDPERFLRAGRLFLGEDAPLDAVEELGRLDRGSATLNRIIVFEGCPYGAASAAHWPRVQLHPFGRDHAVGRAGSVRGIGPRAGVGVDAAAQALESRHMRVAEEDEVRGRGRTQEPQGDGAEARALVTGAIGAAGVRAARRESTG